MKMKKFEPNQGLIRYEKEKNENLIPDRRLIRYEKEKNENLIPDRRLIRYENGKNPNLIPDQGQVSVSKNAESKEAYSRLIANQSPIVNRPRTFVCYNIKNWNITGECHGG
ncbi:hypothetical protein [Bacillus alkalicola]|uniref:Uncharacterized protein n=1 Tax=Evansella alkalicola TaxID=745819 RepID=A0ABS6JTV7_9BACI|nr:hypothetical protein [Bacillus alkalicola]MBU9721999.1 hypothetical protein [Bacillus alkalicola]